MNLWLLLFIIWYIIGFVSIAWMCIRGIQRDGVLTIEGLILAVLATLTIASTGPIMVVFFFKDTEIWKRK